MHGSKLVRLAAGCALVGTIVPILVFLPVKEQLTNFLAWVQSIGPWGPALLAAAYVPASLFFIPGWILTLGSGFAFGVVRGTIAVSAGSVCGASAAFFVGRTLGRGWIEERVSKNPRFRAIDQAVSENGFKIVLLTRLSPVLPFNLLNYAFGLSRVSFRDYVLASWIGMLPATVLYVYFGSAVKNLTDLIAGRIERGVEQKVLFGVGLAATIAVTVLLTRIAKRALDKAVSSTAEQPTPTLQGAPDT